ncbi:MAG TPA: hypothetical protein DCY87_05035, partial [Acidimicrobiaceae bacterium]|nr:hypothetical protein [Acidimicrobiaceae bacterium]
GLPVDRRAGPARGWCRPRARGRRRAACLDRCRPLRPGRLPPAGARPGGSRGGPAGAPVRRRTPPGTARDGAGGRPLPVPPAPRPGGATIDAGWHGHRSDLQVACRSEPSVAP